MLLKDVGLRPIISVWIPTPPTPLALETVQNPKTRKFGVWHISEGGGGRAGGGTQRRDLDAVLRYPANFGRQKMFVHGKIQRN